MVLIFGSYVSVFLPSLFFPVPTTLNANKFLCRFGQTAITLLSANIHTNIFSFFLII